MSKLCSILTNNITHFRNLNIRDMGIGGLEQNKDLGAVKLVSSHN